MKITTIILSFLSLILCDRACAYTIDYSQKAVTDTIPSKLLAETTPKIIGESLKQFHTH